LNITDASLAVIGYYGKSVTDLTLARLAAVGERGFWVMANANGLQNLRCISVTSCPGVTDLAIVSIAKFCSSLKQLCLNKCEHVSDAGLKAFAEAAKMLENLQLEECNRVTLVGVLACLINCSQKFRALSLVKCTGVKDICAAPAQLPVCKSLRFLTIKDCPGFTDASLAVVGMICPQLEQVDLSGLGEVSDNRLLPLIKSAESGLVKVDLSGCKNITDVAVSALMKAHGKSIKQVSIEGCSKITDASLFAISENCTELAELDLSNCMVSDSGIASLASAKQFPPCTLAVWLHQRHSEECAVPGQHGQAGGPQSAVLQHDRRPQHCIAGEAALVVRHSRLGRQVGSLLAGLAYWVSRRRHIADKRP